MFRIVLPLAWFAGIAVPGAAAGTIVVQGRDSAAISAAIERSRAGDTVLLRAGAYDLSQPVKPRTGTKIVGEGPEKTILRFVGTAPGPLVDLSDRHDVVLTRLTLDAANSPVVGPGIFAHNAARLRIARVTVRDISGKAASPLAIHFTGDNPTRANGVTDSAIEDCLLENLGVASARGGGIRFSWGSARNRVERCSIRQTGRGGIFANDGSGDLVLRGNTVTGSHGEGLGLEVWNACDRCVIEDNRLDHWLSIGGADRCAVRRNVISDPTGETRFLGIEVIGSEEVITENTVGQGQQIGISVSNINRKEHVLYAYDEVTRCVQWGAQLQGDAGGLSDHYFYRCRFCDNGGTGTPIYPTDAGHGFRINQNARGVVLDRCEIAGNRGIGVQIHGSAASPSDDLLFSACRIQHNAREAASVWPGYTRLAWPGCVVTDNASNALPDARGQQALADVTIDVPADVRAGQPARFTAKGLAPGSFVLWDLDDGVPATTPATTHAYPRPGKYRVSVVAWDTQHNAAHAEKTVVAR